MNSAQLSNDISNPAQTLKAIIIDDAFDNVLENQIPQDETERFYLDVENNFEVNNILNDLGIVKPDFYDISGDDYLEHLNQLWSVRNYNEDLDQYLNKLFIDKIDKLKELNTICENIIKCGIEIEKVSIEYLENDVDLDIFKRGEFTFVFMDCYLGNTDDERAKEKSIEWAKKIYSASPIDKKPITILMSSISEEKVVPKNYRSKASILEVAFMFYRKDVLKDTETVYLRITALKFLIKHYYKIQNYIFSLSNAADKALKEFKKEIKTFSIDDYSFIQYAKLNVEEHPLGDYMTWLYGSRWGSLLYKNRNLQKQQSEIDKLTVLSPIILHKLPTEYIANIYYTAIFDSPIEPLGPNPFNPQSGLPYLHIGDIFSSRKDNPVWIVLTPQCDLERNPNPEMSIIFVPGKLVSVNDISGKDQLKTDFLLFDNSPFKIYWNVKEFITIKYDLINKWIKKNKLKRDHRLKLPFALAIQQSFTSHISRIGSPVSPPINNHVDIEILVKGLIHPSKPVLRLHEFKKGASISNMRVKGDEKTKVVFDVEFPILLSKIFKNTYFPLLEKLLERNTSNLKVHTKITKQFTAMTSFVDSFFNSFQEFHPYDVPKNGSLKKDPIPLALDFDIKSPLDHFFVINIKSKNELIEIPNFTDELEDQISSDNSLKNQILGVTESRPIN